MADLSELPFRAEYAKSGRSSCKVCKLSIAKDALRLAVMVQSPAFDGKVPHWYHEKCFWNRARVKAHTDIHGFDSLRWEDQKIIKDKLGLSSGGGNSGSSGGGDSGSGGNAYKDYKVEYAKTSASKCRGCEEKIAKNLVRISKKEFTSLRAQMYGPADAWHHVDCFITKRDALEFWDSMDVSQIPGFHVLKKEDRDELLAKIGVGDPKKRKSEEAKNNTPAKKAKLEDSAEEKALQAQSKLLWGFRDSLEKHVSNNALKGLLEFNEQDLPSGESRLRDRVSDCMAFGALKRCPECKDGQLTYSSSGGYVCTGNISEWTKCMYVTKNPKRVAFKIPKEYTDVDCLKKYKYVKRERIFPKETAMSVSASLGPVSSALDPSKSAARPDKPLHNLKFVLCGKFSKSSSKIKKTIEELGGSVSNKVTKGVAAVVGTTDQLKEKSQIIKTAEKLEIQVVDETFVDAVAKGGCIDLIKKHNIAPWGADPQLRIGDTLNAPNTKSIGKSYATASSSDNHFTKKLPDKMKMMVKGGAAVDPDSELAEEAHVLQDKGDPMSVVLGLVDLVKGTNSYYKLQVLESDVKKRYWVFRSWGRVGTSIGGNKLQKFGDSKDSAVNDFETLYLDKTGNEWSNRKNFQKQAKKFYPLELDYGQEDDDLKSLSLTNSTSKLADSVKKLVQMIFDIESMKRAMLEFEIDLKKMPLGKLSKNQIEKAYKLLSELNKLVEDGATTTKFLDASNKFYTLIPHDFGMNKPPLLDTAEVVKAKTEMLDNLLEIEIAYNLLKGGNKSDKDPIDAHYDTLKTEICPMDKESEEYKRLIKYVKNTHAATHNLYDLEVKEIFKVDREGESARFKPFKKLHNRQLLWHGSRITNYAGILSQGLRIAPPEAPCTGYMFGKGVYFADMVSKSANYCNTSRANPTGLLMLCEVALGNMYERMHSEYVSQLPKGKHSTKGVGRTAPDPAETYTTEDGVTMPIGPGTSTNCGANSLLYNEYIVYDVSQISIKYLLQTEFKWKY